MKYYVEITLIDGEKSLYELWTALYSQVHFSLVEMQKMNIQDIGVSFPNYRFLQKDDKTFGSLGDKLRIFAESQALLGIFVADLQNRLNDYVKNWEDFFHFKSIKTVPENHTHAIFKRYQPSSSKEALARRFARRHSVDYQTALERLKDYQPELINYPFIELNSETTKHQFKLSIIKIPTNELVSGKFNFYGLGAGSVPDF